MRRPRRRWRDPAPPPAGESRSPGSSPRYETPSRTRSPRRPVALHTRAHHDAQHGARPLTTAPPLSLPHRCTRQSSTPSLASPSSQSKHASEPRPDSPQVQRNAPALEPNMDLPPRMQVLTTTLLPLPHSPTELRPSAERRAERLRPSAGHGGRRHAAAGPSRRHPPPRAGAISLDCP